MISEELKAIVDKFKEQGKMNFLDETTEEKILEFEKEKEITEDQLKTLEKDIQKATDDAVNKIDSMIAEKEKELLTV